MKTLLLAFFITGITQIWTQTVEETKNSCGDGQWACLDGGCIPAVGKCNGTIECADGTDESFPTCRRNVCGEQQFRCTYGACVDLTASCDDVQNCADNSDELLPICRNDVDTNICRKRLTDTSGLYGIDCLNSRDICDDNTPVNGQRCDGRVDCADKSDETLSTCADAKCEDPLFRCAYGGCVKEDASCDGVADCPDGSDETAELCDRISPGAKITKNITTPKPLKPLCTLPPYPEFGSYTTPSRPEATPGMQLDDYVVYIQYSCEMDYGILGESALFCTSGDWSGDFPKCVRFCKVPAHPSVDYHCILNSFDDHRACNLTEPDGTTIQPVCRGPVYHHVGILPSMRCVDGSWDYVAVCEPVCGMLEDGGDPLIAGGHTDRGGELPWHAGVYKRGRVTKPICGGTIVSTTIVISAAQCFWSDTRKQLPASDFAVSVGKRYRSWNSSWDGAQLHNVRSIKIPEYFEGSTTNFQGDIALVKLVSPIVYSEVIRPVCLDFDEDFDSQQLLDGSLGRVAGWGFTSENRTLSAIINVVDLPYVKVERCIAIAPEKYKVYITSDKICAGDDNTTAICEGDSGGGLSFPEQTGSARKFYLRGVASSSSDSSCRVGSVTAFTHLLYHKDFLQDNMQI